MHNGAAEDLTAFLICATAWGSGVAGQGGDGRGPWRASAALGLPRRTPDARPDPDRLEALRTAVTLSRTEPLVAWQRLKSGPGHLRGFGESFFTKITHFAGYGHGPRPWPLILDLRLRAALSALQHPVLGWGRRHYADYLQTAHQWADCWSVEPQQVEYALFRHAGRTT